MTPDVSPPQSPRSPRAETRPPERSLPDLAPVRRAPEAHLRVTDDLTVLLSTLPPALRHAVEREGDSADLLEIVMDLGRAPTARFQEREVPLSAQEITFDDLQQVTHKVGEFGGDNRAGIPRTLHRISCLRNRRGEIVGLTLRVGRAVYGTTAVIEDLLFSDQSILLLGRPGVGKTTMLREAARILAESGRRVIIVDTSNEIAGDGDIPHPGIGRARRMQVPTPAQQHAVMVEAVENHMPEVIVIDEIGAELEAQAARTIAERGVQLVATAHGNTLANLLLNPTLSDLIGGIQSVTLSDEEARRRGTRKSVLERKAPPTFDILVEIQSFQGVSIHPDVATTVDSLLRGFEVTPVVREMDDEGVVHKGRAAPTPVAPVAPEWREEPEREAVAPLPTAGPHRKIYPLGISQGRLLAAIRETGANASLTEAIEEAAVMMTLRSIFRRRPPPIREAEARGVPIYVLKHNTLLQMEQSLRAFTHGQSGDYDPTTAALAETEEAIRDLTVGEARSVELTPQNAYIRRLQHEMAQRYDLYSSSKGREPYRRVRLFRT